MKKNQTLLVPYILRHCDFSKDISNYCKSSIKGEIVSINALLLAKNVLQHICQQIHNLYPFFPMSYISCFNCFESFIALWYKDLNNYTDLHKTITIKLYGFSWWVSICGNYKKWIVLSLCYFCQICPSPDQLLLSSGPHGCSKHYWKQKELRRKQNWWILHIHTQLCFSTWHLTFIID